MSEQREILQPLREPVSIRKALLAGRVAVHTTAIGGEHSAFLVNIQLTGWNNTEQYTAGFVEGFNRAAQWMQAAVLQHLSADTRDAARYRAIRATTKAVRDDGGGERMDVTPDQLDAAADELISSEPK